MTWHQGLNSLTLGVAQGRFFVDPLSRGLGAEAEMSTFVWYLEPAESSVASS